MTAMTRRRVVGFDRRARGYRLDCDHVASASLVNGRSDGITCPVCARRWCDAHWSGLPERMRQLPAYRRLYALAYPEPPVRGERVPVQGVLINDPPRSAA